ncbi:MAG: Cardiolipin synthase B, partial [Chlamydiae bacterium]|nr:Cardiolipin synthase B [Chlamydiota bacterium]
MFLRIIVFIFFISAHCVANPSKQYEVEDLILLPEARQEGIDVKNDPFILFLDQAEKEILMASYKLQEKKLPQKDMLDALKKAVKRGVEVHVITENRLTDVEIVEDAKEVGKSASLNAYKDRGVKVYSSSEKFNQSHTKYIVIDGKEAMLGTTNFDKELEGHTSNERPSRDFAVKIRNPEIISELTRAFWNDIKGIDFVGSQEHLLWGPKNQREKLKEFIESAQDSIKIYQQDITDSELIEALVGAATNNIEVELIMSPHPFGFNNPDNNIENQKKLTEAGGKVYLTNDL